MITSLDNKKVKDWTKLHNKKYRTEEYLLFNPLAIKEAKKKGLLKTLIYVDKMPFSFDSSYEVSKEVMKKISKQDNIPYLGIASKLEEKESFKNRVLLLDNIQDPLNLGRIIELCYAFGYDSLIISEDTCDLYHPHCIEAAKEAFYKVNIKRKDLKSVIKELKEKQFKIFATGLSNKTKDINTIKKEDKMAFILGNEGSGISKEIFDLSDEIIKINMNNLDSLNVAMAGSIVLYKFNNL